MIGLRAPTDGCTTVTIYSAVRTSELEYTVVALINRKCINNMIYMISVIYDFTHMTYVI